MPTIRRLRMLDSLTKLFEYVSPETASTIICVLVGFYLARGFLND